MVLAAPQEEAVLSDELGIRSNEDHPVNGGTPGSADGPDDDSAAAWGFGGIRPVLPAPGAGGPQSRTPPLLDIVVFQNPCSSGERNMGTGQVQMPQSTLFLRGFNWFPIVLTLLQAFIDFQSS